VVHEVSTSLLGTVGGILAILGVVILPITSGDTAFRSARLIVADFLKLTQKPMAKRLLIAIPMFILGFIISKAEFGVIWRYFGWANQTTAVMMLWAAAAYSSKRQAALGLHHSRHVHDRSGAHLPGQRPHRVRAGDGHLHHDWTGQHPDRHGGLPGEIQACADQQAQRKLIHRQPCQKGAVRLLFLLNISLQQCHSQRKSLSWIRLYGLALNNISVCFDDLETT
jgi:hypothetical protein